jgi:glycosyltransferase A (GT-A) superfamily protein (DUF2064 family)
MAKKKRVILLLAHAPDASNVSSLIAGNLSRPQASTLAAALLLDTVGNALSVPDADVTIAVSPPRRVSSVEALVRRSLSQRAEKITFIAQHGSTAGARTENAIDAVFREGANRVVAVSAMCPCLSSRELEDALSSLEHNDVVLGPSMDGAVLTVGLAQPRPELFASLSMEGNGAYRELADRVSHVGCSMHEMEVQPGVGTEEDMTMLQMRLAELSLVDELNPAHHTSRVLGLSADESLTDMENDGGFL